MNNFFLLNEAIKTTTVEDIEDSIGSLNSLLLLKVSNRDFFLRGSDFWNFKTSHGYIYEFTYSVISPNYQRILPKLFDSGFSESPVYFSNKEDFDFSYPNDCNGFLGVDFSSVQIDANIQVFNESTFQKFIDNCLSKNTFNSVQNFWAKKEELFSNLVFCDRVLSQISNMSINDDRFKLINEKLKVLDRFTENWKKNKGVFEYKNLGLDNSPDTPSRVKATLVQRTFVCPNIGSKVFSLHIKWYFGSEVFRLYYYPSDTDFKVYVGYIGDKSGIGF